VAENVEELLTRFQEHLMRSDLASTTIVNYLADMRTFARWHTEVRGVESSLWTLTRDDIQEYCHYMQAKKGWAPATINRRLQAVRKFYSFAMDMGLMENNPASEVKLIPIPGSDPPRALSPEEVASLLRAVQMGRPGLIKRNYAIILLLLQTGIKLGELIRLRLSDLQLWGNGEGLLLVREHDGSSCRQVPLNSLACAALQEYLQVRPVSDGTDNLFLSQGGDCISRRTVQRLVNICAKAAGLEDVSTNVLRHTFAMSTLEETADLSLVARLLGHRCLESTTKYEACIQ
jgi:site-specific recombinase XerD